MIDLTLSSPVEVMQNVASRAKEARLAQNLTQLGLSQRADVSLGTLKLFESKGKASFETVVKIAFALGAETGLEGLFPPQSVVRIEDIIAPAARKRGRRK